MNRTAKEAIARSTALGQIITVEYDQAAHHELAAQADDYVDTDTVTEFWGMCPDRRDGWRVHMRVLP